MIKYTRKKSLRLQNYDYGQNGLYFITICTKNSQPLFGTVSEGKMQLNQGGEMIKGIWSEIPKFYKGFLLHNFVVMPNHFHAIIEIVGTMPPCLSDMQTEKQLTIPQIIHRFKTLTTQKYINGVHHQGWEGFQGKLWQRSYHEHIIRNEKSYETIIEYIQNNPLRWVDDCYYD